MFITIKEVKHIGTSNVRDVDIEQTTIVQWRDL